MFQPYYPLVFSETDGSYQMIKDLKETIKQDALILLNVSPGEWPGNPDLGVGVRRYLFEPSTSPMWQELHKRIKNQFAKYLPFIEIVSHLETKDVYGNNLEDYNYAKLVIKYRVESVSVEEIINYNLIETADL